MPLILLLCYSKLGRVESIVTESVTGCHGASEQYHRSIVCSATTRDCAACAMPGEMLPEDLQNAESTPHSGTGEFSITQAQIWSEHKWYSYNVH